MTTLLVNISDEQEERALIDFLNSHKYNYSSLVEREINPMSVSVAQSSFSKGWGLEDKDENEYWNSFVK